MAELMQAKRTTLEKEDLIYPHKQSHVPGYLGYTPQQKFHCGHTYGYQTDKLNKTYLRKRDHHEERPSTAIERHDLVPIATGGEKYFQQMVPGYSGFVPKLQTRFGSRYKEATENAIQEFNANVLKTRNNSQQLSQYVQNVQSLKVRSDFPRPETAHPGIDLRYATAERSPLFTDKRAETDPPTIGYQGHIPRKIEHYVGSRYTAWSGRALQHAEMDRFKRKDMATQDIPFDQQQMTLHGAAEAQQLSSTYAPHSTSNRWSRYGSVYDKKGMIPKYMGYVPQLPFSLGTTYGDGSRAVPACYDTSGYATGRYNNPGESVERITIKA